MIDLDFAVLRDCYFVLSIDNNDVVVISKILDYDRGEDYGKGIVEIVIFLTYDVSL